MQCRAKIGEGVGGKNTGEKCQDLLICKNLAKIDMNDRYTSLQTNSQNDGQTDLIDGWMAFLHFAK